MQTGRCYRANVWLVDFQCVQVKSNRLGRQRTRNLWLCINLESLLITRPNETIRSHVRGYCVRSKCIGLPEAIRGTQAAPRGVLAKASKPGQELRVDLPTIGPETVEAVARAGLAGLAAVAGAAIVAEPQRVAQLAEERGVFVVGIKPTGAGA